MIVEVCREGLENHVDSIEYNIIDIYRTDECLSYLIDITPNGLEALVTNGISYQNYEEE